jgi:cellulose synthase/poly-beta-1,6-N-acetylglucosamine synthase-like glycosyltransferase
MNDIVFYILQIIFWLCSFLLVYSYVLFPILLKILSKNKIGNSIIFNKNDTLPHVSILMSLYNEEKVIIDKLNTLVAQNFPSDKLSVYIGSDCSSDHTNILVKNFIEEHNLSNFHFHPFINRQGKPGVINQLHQYSTNKNGQGINHILIITDASVLLEKNTVFHLIKHFKNDKIGLVDSNMKHIGIQENGISKSEDSYISGEVKIKYRESIINGKMMGPFGGCYAMRSDLFIPVPSNFLVDDFYLAMNVLDKGKDAINELEAICKESVSQKMSEEYRRKRRISAGNFQNLVTYKHLLLPSRANIAFHFIPHKVLRWLGPFFIIVGYIANLILALDDNLFYLILFSLQTLLIFIIPIFDFILQQFNVHIIILRSIRYFFMMNLALLEGFINYLKGVQSNVWQPTKRPDSTE